MQTLYYIANGLSSAFDCTQVLTMRRGRVILVAMKNYDGGGADMGAVTDIIDLDVTAVVISNSRMDVFHTLFVLFIVLSGIEVFMSLWLRRIKNKEAEAKRNQPKQPTRKELTAACQFFDDDYTWGLVSPEVEVEMEATAKAWLNAWIQAGISGEADRQLSKDMEKLSKMFKEYSKELKQ